MKFPRKQKKQHGDVRVRKIFAFLPIKTSESIYWLETVTVEEKLLYHCPWYYPDYTLFWIKKFVNGEPVK